MPTLDSKVAVVTGSSRGIGRAIAERLAHDGARVAVNYVRDREAAEATVAGIEAAGGLATAIRADIGRPADVVDLFDRAEERFGALDIVVANAGVAVIKPMVDCTVEDYELVFNANARGTFLTLQEGARRVRAGGRIIATSTGGTQMWFAETSLYLGSKGAVEQFVRALSRELGTREITVNAISPGFTDTDLLPERDRAVAAEQSPFGRIGSPHEVAAAAAFLATDDAGWITGQNLAVGGGVF